MPTASINTTPSSLTVPTGGAVIFAVSGDKTAASATSVDIYVNGELTPSLTLPAGAGLKDFRRRVSGNIQSVKAAMQSGSGSVDYGTVDG